MSRLLSESIFTNEGPTGPRFPLDSMSFLLAPGSAQIKHHLFPEESTSVLLITPSKTSSPLLLPRAGYILSSSKKPETKCGEELVRHDLGTVQLSG